MKVTFHSQSTATWVPSLVSHGLWSNLTPCKTITHSRAKRSTCTTCQSIKMHLNGTATVCQCPVWSPFKMSPLTGEPRVIFPPKAWTFETTGECHWKFWICLRSRHQEVFVFGPSLSRSVEMSVPTAQFGLLTARCTPFTLIAGIRELSVTSNVGLEEYKVKITSVFTRQPTLPFASLLPWVPQVSFGLEASRLEQRTCRQ